MSDKKDVPVYEMFEIKLEAQIPCTLTYRVRAQSIDEAFKKIDKQSPNNIKHHLNRKKNIKGIAYTAGTVMVRGNKIYK